MHALSDTPTSDLDLGILDLCPPPAALRDFVQSLLDDDCIGPQKRRAPRYRLAAEVRAVPLDDQYRRIGEPFVAWSVNISTGGICLIHTRPLDAPYLLIVLGQGQSAKTRLVVRIRHCHRLSRFYQIGCEFLARSDEEADARARSAPHGG